MSSLHLTPEARTELSALHRAGCTLQRIAEVLGCTQPSVSRELRRGRMPRGTYDARVGRPARIRLRIHPQHAPPQVHYASHSIRGSPLHITRNPAGHRNIATTLGYLRIFDEDLHRSIWKIRFT